MRRNRLFVSCLALAIFLSAGLNDARSTESEEAKQVTCSGKVVDEQGRPVTDVKIKLYKVAVETTALSYKMELARQAATEADGTFTINSEVIDDQYSNQAIILADKEGMALGWDNWRLLENANVEIVLGPPEVLAGTVVDEAGGPIDDAEVGISFMMVQAGGQPRYLVGYMSLEFLSIRSDAEGKFSFGRIPAEASAEFVVKKPGRATVSTFNPQGFQGGSLQFSAGQTDIKIVHPVGAKIEGVVAEKASGKPVGGVRIMAIRGRNQPSFGLEPIVSKEDGTFSVDGLAPGEHLLQIATVPGEEADWISEPVEVSVEAGKTKSGVRVELTKGGVLEVLVTDSITKQPVDKATVSIQPVGGSTSSGSQTDEAGIARTRLMPGEYQISYLYKQGYSRQRLQEDTITIEDSKTVRVEMQLAGMPKITGVVQDESGKSLEGVKLRVCPMGGSQDATTDAEGKFEADYDPGGWGGRETPIMFLVGRYETGNLAAAVEIEEDAREVDIILKPAVTFAGRVVDPDGKGIASARITVMLRVSNWGSSIGRDRITTDKQGKFEVKAIPAEHKYSLYVVAEGYGEKRKEEINTDDAVNNHLDIGELTLAVANLSVSGVVVDNDGKPVAGARIYCSGEGQSRSRAETDIEGKFTLEKVCAGRIRINADKSGTTRLYGNIETEGGATDVRIVISQRSSVTRYEPKRPPSLVGRPLPELKEAGIDLPPAETDGKIMLVCFFDMEQRPSRHCVTQLAKQAEQLKGKGVTIVAVQASEMDQDALSQWKNKYNIPFPVGMVQGNAEKARFTWGVRSLPWLILTDSGHIIRSTGFRFNKLNEKIGEMANVER